MVIAQSRFKSVWDALESDPRQAQSLKLRSALVIAINEYCSSRSVSAENVIERLCIEAGRVAEIKNGQIDKFSLDELVDLAHRLDLKVTMEIV